MKLTSKKHLKNNTNPSATLTNLRAGHGAQTKRKFSVNDIKSYGPSKTRKKKK